MQTQLVLLITLCASFVFGQTVPRIEPEIISGIVGERVNITCVVGTVEPELTQLVTTGSLQLDAVKLVLSDKVIFTYGPLMPADDNRPVMCSYGQSPFPTGTITVLFPAEYSSSPSMASVPEGNNVSITLTVNANPLPTDEQTTWTFDGGALGPNVVVTYNSITITNIVRSQAGTYTVTSTTSGGTSTPFNVQIIVEYPPLFQEVSGPCDISSMPITCAVQEGGMGTFTCDVFGVPLPSVNIQAQTEDGYSITNNLVELNGATSAANNAAITCMASNIHGTINREYRVYVGAVPSAPTDVTPIVDIDSDTVNVTWVFDNSGNNVPLIQFTFIVSEGSTIVFEGNVDADLRIAIIALSTLMPGTRYDVSITAHNLLGMSQAGGNQFTTFGGSSAVSTTSCLVSVLLMVVVTFFLRT